MSRRFRPNSFKTTTELGPAIPRPYASATSTTTGRSCTPRRSFETGSMNLRNDQPERTIDACGATIGINGSTLLAYPDEHAESEPLRPSDLNRPSTLPGSSPRRLDNILGNMARFRDLARHRECMEAGRPPHYSVECRAVARIRSSIESVSSIGSGSTVGNRESACLASLAGEPVCEMRGPELGVLTGNERSLGQLGAEVARVRVGENLARISEGS